MAKLDLHITQKTVAEVTDFCNSHFTTFLSAVEEKTASGTNVKRLGKTSLVKSQLKYFYGEYFSVIVNKNLISHGDLAKLYALVWPKGNLQDDINKYLQKSV